MAFKLPTTTKNTRFLRARATILVTVVEFQAPWWSSRTDSGLLMASPGQNQAKIWPEQQKTLRFASFGTLFSLFVHLEGLEVAKTMKNTMVFAFQGQDSRGSCRILSFLVLSRTDSGLLMASPGLNLGCCCNGLRKRSGYCTIDNFGAFVVFPHFGGLRSRKPRKYKGPWKWPPEKERVLQNRRFWCICWVPPISAALEAGNPRNARGLGCTLFFST